MCDCSRCEQVLVFPWDQRELLRFRHSQPFGGERFIMLKMKFVYLKYLLWGCWTELCLYIITIFSKMVLIGLVFFSVMIWEEIAPNLAVIGPTLTPSAPELSSSWENRFKPFPVRPWNRPLTSRKKVSSATFGFKKWKMLIVGCTGAGWISRLLRPEIPRQT